MSVKSTKWSAVENVFMSPVANVAFHTNQFPDAVRRQLIDSLRGRAVNHKFHYESVKQAQNWLAVHKAYSPYQTDPDCAEIYRAAFGTVASKLANSGSMAVVGVGCGAGQKDVALLESVALAARSLCYLPCDVSAPLALMAYASASQQHPSVPCFPVVCDLLEAEDLGDVVSDVVSRDATRVVTFFGMLPNFEPGGALKLFAGLLRTGDHLLLSANLAPGPNYDDGIKKIFPLYDNALTREWLMTFLLDLGVERTDGEIRFIVEEIPSDLKRIAAYFDFKHERRIAVGEEHFTFSIGESIRLFFSYRYTPERLGRLLKQHGIATSDQWITKSEEEGVFLCERGG